MNALINQLQLLSSKQDLSEDELKTLSAELHRIFGNLAKGAFIRSRAKWLEEGEKNSSYFFALEKRNNVASLNVNGVICSDPNNISKYITSFYSKLHLNSIRQSVAHLWNPYETLHP